MEISAKTEKISLFYGTSETIRFQPETIDNRATYTLAVKEVRNPGAPAMVLSTGAVSGQWVIFEISTFTVAFRAVSLRSGRAWLEIHTEDKVLLQREIAALPRTDVDGDPAPIPVKDYYPQEEVDALLAGISEVELDAEDVGALSATGRKIEALTASAGVVTVPAAEDKVYTCALTGGEEIALSAPAAGRMTTVELHFAMPSTAVSFTFRDSILWKNSAELFSSSAAAPDFSEGGVEYAVILRHDGTAWLGNLAYTKEL